MLVHIGYHKTATTWFQQHYVPEHPALERPFRNTVVAEHIVYPHPLRYDVAATREQFGTYLRRVRDMGRLPVVSAERLSGSPYSGGYDSALIASRLCDLFPEALVWIVIREQVDVITSIYKHYVKENGVATPERWLGEEPPMNVPTFRFEHYEYGPLIRHYHQLFGRDRVLVTIYEDLCEEPVGAMATLCRFIGVEPASVDFGRVLNVSLSDRSARILRICNVFRDFPGTGQYPVLATGGHERLRRWLSRLDERGWWRRNEGSLRDRVRELVGDRYRSSNRELADLIGTHVTHRGWET